MKKFAFILPLLLICVRADAHYLGRGAAAPPESIPAPGTVRAEVVVSPAELPGGPFARGLAGDFRLYNNRVSFIISGVRPVWGRSPFGGVIEDAAILAHHEAEPEWYNLMGRVFPMFYQGDDPVMGGRLFEPKKAEILKDGSDGEAIVRVRGIDAEFTVIKEIFMIAPKPIKVRVTIDYILRPDSQVLEARYTFENPGTKNITFSLAQTYLLGDGIRLFAPGAGFDTGAMTGKNVPLLAAAGGGVSYGWFLKDSDIFVNVDLMHHIMATMGGVRVPPGGTTAFSVFHVVGDGDVDDVLHAIHEFKKDSGYGTITGKCITRGHPDTSTTDVMIYALNENNEIVNQAAVRANGSYTLTLPPGKYRLQAASYNRVDPEPVAVTVAENKGMDVNLEIDSPGSFSYNITDQEGLPIPATVSFRAIDGKSNASDAPSFLHLKTYGKFYLTEFTSPGGGVINIRPGKYEVYVSRGFEYEVEKREIAVASGETVKLDVTLNHVVDTAGYLSSDFHIHAAPSHDSTDMLEWKVAGFAGSGLEIPIATDHDVNTDYMPAIRALGFESFLKSIIGDEVTTQRLGHFNAFPLIFDPAKPNGGAIDWLGLTGGEIFQALRDDSPNTEVVQINHGRETALGYFGYISYDPKTGTAADKKNFSLNFDAMEILNSTGYNSLEKLWADWSSFLNRGKRVAGVGNSDSHSVYALQVGYPRNYVRSTTDSPSELNVDDFIAAIRGQEITVCGGPFITVTLNGTAGPGGMVSDAGGAVNLDIVIQAPSWVMFDKVELLANGEVIETFPVSGTAGPAPVRFVKKLSLKPERDTWYVVRASGGGDLFPVYPGARPYSFTNPVYADVDGNGKFDPMYSFPE